MDRLEPDAFASQYERDFYTWTQEQAAALRRRDAAALDWDNLAEEIDALGRSEREAVESHLETIVEHLLKLVFSPVDSPRRGWRVSVAAARVNADRKLTPTYRRHLAETLATRYGYGRRLAAAGLAEDGLTAADLPTECPWTLDQLLDPDFWPF